MLVPLDGSATGEAALRRLHAVGDRRRLDVRLLHVVEPVNPTLLIGGMPRRSPLRVVEERYDAARAYLERVRRRLEGTGVRARIALRSGRPDEQILAEAREGRAAMIAMATHGRTGLRRVLMGSVAEAVVTGARVPVLLVRAGLGSRA
jgi:nucleotide-binding universal stress UspA family protein